MQHTIIFCVFLSLVIILDLIPIIRRKEWSYLYFSIPVYVVTLLLNLMIGGGMKYPSFAKILKTTVLKFIK